MLPDSLLCLFLVSPDEVTNTYPRLKKPIEAGTKRSASENNMNGQLYTGGKCLLSLSTIVILAPQGPLTSSWCCFSV